MTTAPASHATDGAPSPRSLERPQFHFTPARHWMNDPNGLVFVDGVYHLYYQYNPYGMSHADISWGHATSVDLVHWTEQPIAIPADLSEQVFSGSIVVDTDNTSGLGSGDRAPLIALYTSAYQRDSHYSGRQSQSIAFSGDGGFTWTKYAGNPVLDRASSDFRDPKVFRYESGVQSYWVMVAAEALDHAIVLYRSDDLVTWDYLSTFGPANATGGVWECPDLFELPVDGSTGLTRWVLTVNLNPGGPAGGSAGQYFIGTFDGREFTSDTPTMSAIPAGDTRLRALDWLDWGRDYYAAVSFDNTPGRRLMIGWMCNWDYAAELPTRPWRSSMTLPREIHLENRDGVVRLVQTPVDPFLATEIRIVEHEDLIVDVGSPVVFDGIHGAFRVDVAAQASPESSWTLTFTATTGHEIVIDFDGGNKELSLDRRGASSGMPQSFPSVETVQLPWVHELFELIVYVDRWSVEVFADGGTATITDLVFPETAIDTVTFSSTGVCRLKRLNITRAAHEQ